MYEQHKGKELSNKIKAEIWFEEENKKSRTEFINWLTEKKYAMGTNGRQSVFSQSQK